MKVEFILGVAGCGKTTYCYEAIQKELQKDEFSSLIMLVPEQFNLQAQMDLSRRLYPGLLRSEVLSFNSLSRDIFKEVGTDSVPIIDDLERIMILKKITEEHKKELVFFKKNTYTAGFIDNINRMITVFEQSDIEADFLREIAEDEKATMLFKSKLRDMSYLYACFNDYIKDKFMTAEKTMAKLAEAIAKSNKIRDSIIWIDGFYGFTCMQVKVLKELFKRARKVVVTLPSDRIYSISDSIKETHPFYESIRVYQNLASVCKEEAVPYESFFLKNSMTGYLSEELCFLQENYLKGRTVSFNKESQNIILSQYSNKHEEVEDLAKKITALVRDEGYRYKDIAVVTGDLNEYKLDLENIFKDYEIPYFLDMKRSIHTNGLIVAMDRVLEVITSNYSYKSMMSLLKTHMFDLKMEEIDKLENYVLKYQIKGRRKWEEKWEYNLKNHQEAHISDEEVNQIKEKILKPIRVLEEHIATKKEKGKITVLELTRGLFQFLEAINAYQTIQNRIERNRMRGERLLEIENQQIWGQVIELLDRLVALLGDEWMQVSMYRKILSSSYAYLEMGIIPHSQDQVLVGTENRSRIPRVKAVFIIGANEGILPKLTDSMQIFSDMDKVTLTQICKGKDYKKDRLNDIIVNECIYTSNFNTYTALTRATDKLFLSYPLVDENGKLLKASSFIYTIKRLFKLQILKPKKDLLEYVNSPVSTFGYVGHLLREELQGRSKEEGWKDIISWYYENDKWRNRFLETTKYLLYTNQQENLDVKTRQMLYGTSLRTNISQLEQFRQCPCCYFIQYGIKAEERKIFQWDRAQIGTIFHSCLERYPKELEALNTSWKEATRDQVNEAIKRAVMYSIQKHQGINKEDARFHYTATRLEKMTKRAIRALTAHLTNSSFTPKDYEISFGQADFPAIRLEIDENREVLIRGQIDRVDMYYKEDEGQYIKILDYKSGKTDFNLTEVYYGLQLQLLLYLDAYLKLNSSYKPAGVFYFHIKDVYVDYEVGMTKEEIEENRLRQFKLSGLVLNEKDIIEALANKGASDILPISIKKDGELSKNSSAASQEQFAMLESHIINTIKNLGREILNGKISARPFKLGEKNPCTYCKYHTICQFDEKERGNVYDTLPKLSKDEIWEKICPNKEEV